MKKYCLFLLFIAVSTSSAAAIPPAPIMTLYRFNGDLTVPYFDIDQFLKTGTSHSTGSLVQGTSVIPCLVIRNGTALTDSHGTPFVGFKVVVDARNATPASAATFKQAVATQKSQMTNNHHCDASVRNVINVKKLYVLNKAPFFDPETIVAENTPTPEPQSKLDQIVRAFHNSTYCHSANDRFMQRRSGLQNAWEKFMQNHQTDWSMTNLANAKHLDFTMRTAMFEGHLDRGCNAYGSCERNIIALSIRNRGREGCSKWQGCRFPGDFQGVSSKVSQYNIWDEFLTQTSALTSCFLRQDLGSAPPPENADDPRKSRYYSKLKAMYKQNLSDFEKILFGNNQDLASIFPDNTLSDVKSLQHYYHAPAMGKCFPGYSRVEYMSGAVAHKGSDFALIANKRIKVDQKQQGGYLFREFVVKILPDRDAPEIIDSYPGFVVDGRKVSLKTPSGCFPYGVPKGCNFESIGRYRKAPYWLSSGRPLKLSCNIKQQGAMCQSAPTPETVSVGGSCDTEMRPVAGVR